MKKQNKMQVKIFLIVMLGIIGILIPKNDAMAARIKLHAYSRQSGKVVVSWTKQKNADGYQMFFSSNKDFKTNTMGRNYSKSKRSVTVKIAQGNNNYIFYVKVRPYRIKNQRIIYGKWSKIRYGRLK